MKFKVTYTKSPVTGLWRVEATEVLKWWEEVFFNPIGGVYVTVFECKTLAEAKKKIRERLLTYAAPTEENSEEIEV